MEPAPSAKAEAPIKKYFRMPSAMNAARAGIMAHHFASPCLPEYFKDGAPIAVAQVERPLFC
jgi:hypothetical protein